jgi:hypothetical protein
MSYYGAEIHKFILGELRTDEWKSDGRREQERRRVEEMGKEAVRRRGDSTPNKGSAGAQAKVSPEDKETAFKCMARE